MSKLLRSGRSLGLVCLLGLFIALSHGKHMRPGNDSKFVLTSGSLLTAEFPGSFNHHTDVLHPHFGKQGPTHEQRYERAERVKRTAVASDSWISSLKNARVSASHQRNFSFLRGHDRSKNILKSGFAQESRQPSLGTRLWSSSTGTNVQSKPGRLLWSTSRGFADSARVTSMRSYQSNIPNRRSSLPNLSTLTTLQGSTRPFSSPWSNSDPCTVRIRVKRGDNSKSYSKKRPCESPSQNRNAGKKPDLTQRSQDQTSPPRLIDLGTTYDASFAYTDTKGNRNQYSPIRLTKTIIPGNMPVDPKLSKGSKPDPNSGASRVAQKLKEEDLGKSGQFKGTIGHVAAHLRNHNYGGSGKDPNLTPTTNALNQKMKNYYEKLIKRLLETIQKENPSTSAQILQTTKNTNVKVVGRKSGDVYTLPSKIQIGHKLQDGASEKDRSIFQQHVENLPQGYTTRSDGRKFIQITNETPSRILTPKDSAYWVDFSSPIHSDNEGPSTSNKKGNRKSPSRSPRRRA